MDSVQWKECWKWRLVYSLVLTAITNNNDDKKYLGTSSRGWFCTQSPKEMVFLALLTGKHCKILEPYSWISKLVLASSLSRWGFILSCQMDTFNASSFIVSSYKMQWNKNNRVINNYQPSKTEIMYSGTTKKTTSSRSLAHLNGSNNAICVHPYVKGPVCWYRVKTRKS